MTRVLQRDVPVGPGPRRHIRHVDTQGPQQRGVLRCVDECGQFPVDPICPAMKFSRSQRRHDLRLLDERKSADVLTIPRVGRLESSKPEASRSRIGPDASGKYSLRTDGGLSRHRGLERQPPPYAPPHQTGGERGRLGLCHVAGEHPVALPFANRAPVGDGRLAPKERDDSGTGPVPTMTSNASRSPSPVVRGEP